MTTDNGMRYATVRVGYYLDNSQTTHPWQDVRSRYGAEKAGNKIVRWRPLPSPPSAQETDHAAE